jgi:hypothetical protein
MRSVSETGHRRVSKMINKLCGKLSPTGGFKTSDPVRVGIILGTRNFNQLPRLSDKRLAVIRWTVRRAVTSIATPSEKVY